MFKAQVKPKEYPLKKWAFYLTFLGLPLALGYLFFAGDRVSQLVGFFVYTSVAASVIPLPMPPYLIALGKVFDPGIVAVVGALGNCVSAVAEYYLITWFFSGNDLQQRIEANSAYQKFSYYFQKAVFPTLLFSAFSPLPFEPFRLAAILMRYNLTLYLLAVFFGRLPRYYLIALVGETFTIPNSYLAAMLVVLLLLPLLGLLFRKKDDTPTTTAETNTSGLEQMKES